MRLKHLIRWRAHRRMRRLAATCTSVPVHGSQIELVNLYDQAERHASSLTQPCHGCAHSAADAPFPGHPSGERPCGFCVRNPEGPADWFGDRGPRWYDGETPPFKTPMDCYIATDRLQQQQIFDTLDEHQRTGKPIPPREKYSAGGDGEAWCCEGGDGPEGHTWTCWRWRGLSFG